MPKRNTPLPRTPRPQRYTDPSASVEAYQQAARSFQRSLMAQNKAARTVETYMRAVRLLGEFLEERGMPLDPPNIRREHVETYISDMLTRPNKRNGQPLKPATASVQYRALQSFFKWCVEESEIRSSPMEKMHPPHIPDNPPPVIADDVLRALLSACEGKDYTSRRDTAIIRLLVDTGMRSKEISGLLVEDIDLEARVAVVLGKGSKVRQAPFGNKTALALDRYMRLRSQHGYAHLPDLWLGRRGPLTASAFSRMLKFRAKRAGLPHIHLHLFRHTMSHRWLRDGGQEGDLMRLMGWRSRSMLSRYGASAAQERAREAHRKMAPGDKL